MPRLMFIRHAETELNRDGIFAGRIDCSITQEGFEQVQQSFQLLNIDKDYFDYIYCSPLRRTSQTLQAIIPGSIPIIDQRIIEICIGDWEGQKKDNIDKNLRALFKDGKYTPPGAETTAQVDKRVCEFITSLFESYKGEEKILIVTHNGVMRSIKRNFIPYYGDVMTKNGGSITLTEKNFEYYQQKKRKDEDLTNDRY